MVSISCLHPFHPGSKLLRGERRERCECCHEAEPSTEATSARTWLQAPRWTKDPGGIAILTPPPGYRGCPVHESSWIHVVITTTAKLGSSHLVIAVGAVIPLASGSRYLLCFVQITAGKIHDVIRAQVRRYPSTIHTERSHVLTSFNH